MKHFRLLSLIIVVLIAISSCQKEVNFPPGQGPGPLNPGTGSNGGNNNGNNNNNNNANRSIVGDYDFIGLSANIVSTTTASTAGMQQKSVTTSTYYSINNTGTIQITANQIISNGVGYDVDTLMYVKSYIGGAFMGEISMPFQVSNPPSNSSYPYVKNNADSITVNGPFGAPQGATGSVPTGQTGLRVSWSGDTLLLKVATTVNQNINMNGVSAQLTGTINGVTKLKKK